HQSHLTWVEPFFHGCRPQRLRNPRDRDSQNTNSRFGRSHSKWSRNQLGNGPVSKLWTQSQVPAKKKARAQPAKNKRRICQRRQFPTFPITSRTRLRASALRPDMENTSIINPGNAPTADSDLDEVYDRKPDRVS